MKTQHWPKWACSWVGQMHSFFLLTIGTEWADDSTQRCSESRWPVKGLGVRTKRLQCAGTLTYRQIVRTWILVLGISTLFSKIKTGLATPLQTALQESDQPPWSKGEPSHHTTALSPSPHHYHHKFMCDLYADPILKRSGRHKKIWVTEKFT